MRIPFYHAGKSLWIFLSSVQLHYAINQYNAIRKYVDQETYMNWFRKGHPRVGDILIPTVGTLDALAIMKENRGCIAQNIIAIRTNDNVCNPEFLYYYLANPTLRKELINLDIGGVQPSIKVPHLLSIKISIPPLPEQRAIAATLSCMDDKIELNNRMNKTLEEMAQAIFKSWFVDFEPFQDGEFVDSELGRIPKGWRVGTLNDIANITMGQSPIGTSYNEDNIGTTFFQGRAEFGWRYPQQRLSTTEPKRMAMKGDILLSVRAPVGDVNIAAVDCCIGRGLAAIKSIEGRSSFLFNTINMLSPAFAVYNGEGTVFGSINKDALNSLRVLMPSNEVINKFEMAVSPLDEKIHQLSEEINTLAALRDSLLPKLINGELHVPINP